MTDDMSVPFNVPCVTGGEESRIRRAVTARSLAGDGPFTAYCSRWLEDRTGAGKVFLTTSCTHSLEIAALLAGLGEGDEVIMPSYTFPSTANAFVLRGATIVFVDVRPDTMNMDETLIEAALTPRTRAVVPVHYGGVACDMDALRDLAAARGLFLIEDAAMGLMAAYKGGSLGTLGDAGCYSFHETKILTCGEGGALLVGRPELAARAAVIREKGTNRAAFLEGRIDRYSWIDAGSSYLPSELNAAFLSAQLDDADRILADRLTSWDRYRDGLGTLADRGCVELPFVPPDCRHNASLFYIKTRDEEERTALIAALGRRGIASAFHYVPLHRSDAGRRFGRFSGEDRWTTRESRRLLRLPLYCGMPAESVYAVIQTIEDFYRGK